MIVIIIAEKTLKSWHEWKKLFFQSHLLESFYEDSDIFFPPHFHEEVELFVLLEGRVRTRLDGTDRILSPGSAVLVFPSVVHSYETMVHSRFFISLARCPGTVPSIIGRKCVDPVVQISALRPEFLSICRLLASENSQFSVPSRPERFRGFLLAVYDMVVERLDLDDADPSSSVDVLHRTVLYILEHFHEPLTLDLVARAVGVNRYYLSKVFSAKLGTGFSSYVSSCRVSEAMQLLAAGDMDVEMIGEQCGFESQSSFFRNFRMLTGTSPL